MLLIAVGPERVRSRACCFRLDAWTPTRALSHARRARSRDASVDGPSTRISPSRARVRMKSIAGWRIQRATLSSRQRIDGVRAARFVCRDLGFVLLDITEFIHTFKQA